jgi:hypothetical protein
MWLKAFISNVAFLGWVRVILKRGPPIWIDLFVTARLKTEAVDREQKEKLEFEEG